MKVEARPLAVATAVLLLLGLLGLATIDDARGTRLMAASAATTAQKTARVTMSASFLLGTAESKLSGEGVVDIAGQRSRMTVTAPGLPGPMQLLVEGDTAYVEASLPQFQAMAAGKRWVALDASSAAPGVGGDPLGGGGNPLRALRLLREKGIARMLRENGNADVRGVHTTRHLGKLDVPKLFEAADSQQGDALAGMAQNGDGEAELWLDADDVVRRSVFRLAFQAGGQRFSTTVTMEFFDFGVAADIAPPPADQVHRLD